MRIAFVLPGLLLLAFWASAGSDEPEKVFKDTVKAVQDVTAVLKSVKDKPSAEAAVPKLEDAMKRFFTSFQSANKVPKNEESVKVYAIYGKEIASAGLALDAQVNRLAKQPELMQILLQSRSWKEFIAQEQEAKLQRARVDVKSLTLAIKAWKAKNGDFPLALEVLTMDKPGSPALIKGAGALIDPWDRPYQYEPKTLDPATGVPLIYSFGPDPKDKNGYIRNWK